MNTIVKHTIGFISIVLTLLVFVTLYTTLTFHAKVTIIFDLHLSSCPSIINVYAFN